MALPLLENKRLNQLGIVLVDAETVTPNRYGRANEICQLVLENRLLGRLRPNVGLCGPDSLEFCGENFKRYAEQNANATWDDFLENRPNRIVQDDSDADPRLETKQILIRETGPERTVLGLFVLYNMIVERDGPNRLRVSAMALPGCRKAEGFTLRETWSRIMRRILEDQWPMEDGRTLDMTEWRFPTRPGHRWKLTPEEQTLEGDEEGDGVCDRIVSDLSDHDRTDEDGYPKKIRRKAVAVAEPTPGRRSP